MASKHCPGYPDAKLTRQQTSSSRYRESTQRQTTILVSFISESAPRHRLSHKSSERAKTKERETSMKLGNPVIDNGIKNHMTPKLPPLWKRMSKQEFADIVEKHLGIVTVCCNVLDCTYS